MRRGALGSIDHCQVYCTRFLYIQRLSQLRKYDLELPTRELALTNLSAKTQPHFSVMMLKSFIFLALVQVALGSNRLVIDKRSCRKSAD